MKQAAKEAFESNMRHHDTMLEIAKAYVSNEECSVHQALYHILQKLKLRRNFSALYLVNSHVPEERVQILHSEKEPCGLLDDSPIF